MQNGSILLSLCEHMDRKHVVLSGSNVLEVTEEVFSCLQVRSLEQQNKLLEAEIEAYQNRFENPSGLRLLYEEQLRELKKIADQMRAQRVRKNSKKKKAAHRLCFFLLRFRSSIKQKD